MEIGDIVVRKSYDKDITFKIIDIKEDKGKSNIYIKRNKYKNNSGFSRR